jgi:hypothetical protein
MANQSKVPAALLRKGPRALLGTVTALLMLAWLPAMARAQDDLTVYRPATPQGKAATTVRAKKPSSTASYVADYAGYQAPAAGSEQSPSVPTEVIAPPAPEPRKAGKPASAMPNSAAPSSNARPQVVPNYDGPPPPNMGQPGAMMGRPGVMFDGQGPGAPYAEGAGGCSTCGGGGGGGEGCDDCGWEGSEFWNGPWVPLFRPLHDRVYVKADYLLWTTRGDSVPALASDAPLPSTVYFGDTTLNNDARSGGRFVLGGWLDPCRIAAFEVNYAYVGQAITNTELSTIDNPNLQRPFYNVLTGLQDSYVLSDGGTMSIQNSTEYYTMEMLIRRRLFDSCGAEFDVLAGYRFGSLSDDISINSVDANATINDRFSAQNRFNGVDIGVSARVRRCYWTVDTWLKLGVGSTHSEVNISGDSTLGTAREGGMLALSTNSGKYSQDMFTVMPELGVNLGYDLTQHLRGTVGYTFTYWSRVARAGAQIDPNLNPNYFPPQTTSPGAAFPRFPMATTDFWAQGLSLGIEYQF